MKHTKILLLFSIITLTLYACESPKPGERLWDIVATTQPIAQTINSKLDQLDFVSIFTALDAAQKKGNTVASQLDTVESIADEIAFDFSGIFTAIAELDNKLIIVESKTDELDDGTLALVGYFGIAIRNADVGTTGITLSDAGTYFLAENITYAPSGTGTAAITIDNDNITLNLNGRSITQTNSMGTTRGIRVTSGNNNIQIMNGVIEETTAQAILINSSNTCIAIRNINTLLNENEAGIEFESGCSSISLDFVSAIGSDNNGVLFDTCTDIQVSNGLFADNGVPAEGAGIRFLDCNRIQLSDSTLNDNTHFGVDYFSTTTSEQAEFRNLTIFDNGRVGFSLDNIQDTLITNCYVVGHSTAGTRLTNCHRIKLIENFLDNNDDYNIWLKEGTDNCYIFGNCLMLAGTRNLLEDADSGPNSILGNYALGTAFANNYDILGTTVVNLDTFDQSGAFPSPAPTSWKNMSVQT